jgi:hypothetical protein
MTQPMRPRPVERWLDRDDPLPDLRGTAVIEGKTRMRREGKGFWLPLEARMWHDLGHAHVVDLRVGLGPITFIRGLDGYIDGVGFSRISHTLDAGPEIDQASLLFMWAEAILFPPVWRDREDITWEAVDDEAADVRLPGLGDPVPARLIFDPATGLPLRFMADRHKGVGKPKVEWIVDYDDWATTEDGVFLPSRAAVTWADEPGPWFVMDIRRANPGADISDALERGRAVAQAVVEDPLGLGKRS